VRTLLSRAVEELTRVLFPVFCIGCGIEGEWVCPLCSSKRPVEPIQRCAYCLLPSAYGKTCDQCQKPRRLNGLFVRATYDEWLWRNLIRTWKYGPAEELGQYLGKCFANTELPIFFAKESSVLVPIPLSRCRFRKR